MKKFIFLGSFLILVIFWGVFVRTGEKIQKGNDEMAPTTQETTSSPEAETSKTDTQVVRESSIATSSVAAPSVNIERADARLFVESKEYPVSLAQDNTLLGVMKHLSQTTDFRYMGKDFSGLGFFVESINGKKSEGGMYWILYVNGVLAGEGVSQLIVKPGDKIEWRYEAEK